MNGKIQAELRAKKRGAFARTFLIFFAATLAAVGSFFLIKNEPAIAGAPSGTTRSEEEERTIRVFKTVNEAVVFISTTSYTIDPYDFFPEIQENKGVGSGIVVDSARGIIVTNLHVIENAEKIQIILADGQSYKARLLGLDKETDMAVLQLTAPPSSLPSIPFGDSSKLEVGQKVLAIGNPFGLNRTLTSGIISSLERNVKSPSGYVLRGLIQTDAAINPGNSGGPLLDADGRLIGINTQILSASGDSAGIGFAVPINQIKRVLPELIATGKVLRPKMGWILMDTNQGPMVRRVVPGGPAALAGIQPYERLVKDVFEAGILKDIDRADLVFKVNGERVLSSDEVEEAVSKTEGSKEVELALRQGGVSGAERTVKVRPSLQ